MPQRRKRIYLVISIHAPRTGSDPPAFRCVPQSQNFNPRSPHGERRSFLVDNSDAMIISIHAPRTGSDDKHGEIVLPQNQISIHAPRTGSDDNFGADHFRDFADFNPRSPHGERRCRYHLVRYADKFQSTLPARGATIAVDGKKYATGEISIHAPRTGSDFLRR